jgi:hypothetical protein
LAKKRGAGRLPRVEDLVVVEVAPNEAGAEVFCSVLRQAGIACMHREGNIGAGGMVVGMGPREILVRPIDQDAARSILAPTK